MRPQPPPKKRARREPPSAQKKQKLEALATQDLHPQVLDWDTHSQYTPPTEKERLRNFKAFGIPTDRYYMVDNIGYGHCVFFVWMEFLNLLGQADFNVAPTTINNRTAQMLDLRKLTKKYAKDEAKKKELFAIKGFAEYFNAAIPGSFDHLEPENVAAITGGDWDDQAESCFSSTKQLTREGWHKLNLEDEEQAKMQPMVLFVGGLMAHRFAKYKFRLITFSITVPINSTESNAKVHEQFLPPESTQILIADARSGKVAYTTTKVDLRNRFQTAWDDGRTLFMFMDGSHVNAMFRLPQGAEMPTTAEEIERIKLQQERVKASYQKGRSKKGRSKKGRSKKG